MYSSCLAVSTSEAALGKRVIQQKEQGTGADSNS